MLDANDMIDRCTDMMGPVIGGGVTGNSIMLVLLFTLLIDWMVGLATVGAIGFWAVRRLSENQWNGG
jgi:hypothetical protein